MAFFKNIVIFDGKNVLYVHVYIAGVIWQGNNGTQTPASLRTTLNPALQSRFVRGVFDLVILITTTK